MSFLYHDIYGPSYDMNSYWGKFFKLHIVVLQHTIVLGDLNFTLYEFQIWYPFVTLVTISYFLMEHLDDAGLISMIPPKIQPTWIKQ